MAFTAALVDRARVIDRRQAGVKVEGRTIYGQVSGEWFKARVTLVVSSSSRDPQTGARVVLKTPMLLAPTKDLKGGIIDINVEDKIEVNSRELGSDIYNVTGDPEPLRRKRRLLGWQVPLERVVAHEAPAEVS